jgi:hypothetical protein
MKFGFTGTPSRSPVALERALAQFDFAFHFLDLLGKRDGLGYATELPATHEQPGMGNSPAHQSCAFSN